MGHSLRANSERGVVVLIHFQVGQLLLLLLCRRPRRGCEHFFFLSCELRTFLVHGCGPIAGSSAAAAALLVTPSAAPVATPSASATAATAPAAVCLDVLGLLVLIIFQVLSLSGLRLEVLNLTDELVLAVVFVPLEFLGNLLNFLVKVL